MNRQRVMSAQSNLYRTSGYRHFGATLLCGFSFLALTFPSCEKQDAGVVDFSGAAPYILEAAITPASALLESFPLSNGSYLITAQVVATVSDPQGIADIGHVQYTLFKPGSQSALAQGTLTPSQLPGGGTARTFTATFSFSATRADVGDYRCEILATDAGSLASNTRSLRLSLLLNSTPPVLGTPGIRLLAQRGSDSLFFGLTIDVRDSSGYGTIRDVTVRALATRDSSSRQLFDDGQRMHGDGTAGDGNYSLQLWVSPARLLQDIVFEFNANDADGLKASPVRRAYANRPPTFVDLNVPTEITRPTSGTKLVNFYAVVSDPDGLTDIDSVYFRNLSSSNSVIILMYDDGDLLGHGDALARDETYSRTLSIDATASTGIKEFRFSVVDEGGARVDVSKFISIN
jgi:hypothetical protein